VWERISGALTGDITRRLRSWDGLGLDPVGVGSLAVPCRVSVGLCAYTVRGGLHVVTGPPRTVPSMVAPNIMEL
jgi:hypothetical protein